MEEQDPQHDANLRLKAMLKETGLTSFRLDNRRRGILMGGRTREWVLIASLTPQWFHLYTYVCELPAEPGLRAALEREAMALNSRMNMLKLSAGYGLLMEVEYRAEHVDAETLGNLIGFFHSTLEAEYPKLARIAAGDAALERLESQFRPAASA